jgi:hypothetical protein
VSDQPQIVSLVLSVLLELRGEIEVLECTPLPIDDRYAVRLESRGEGGRMILLPRHLLERALLDPATRRTVRDVIHTGAALPPPRLFDRLGCLECSARGRHGWR